MLAVIVLVGGDVGTPARVAVPLALPDTVGDDVEKAMLDCQDLAALHIHGKLSVCSVFRVHGVLAPGDRDVAVGQLLNATTRCADKALRMEPLVDHPDRQLLGVVLDFETARAFAFLAEAVVQAVVVKQTEAVRAGDARFVLPVELGGPPFTDIGKHVLLSPHLPDHLLRLAVDEDDGTQVAIADEEVALGSLKVEFAVSTVVRHNERCTRVHPLSLFLSKGRPLLLTF